MRVRWSVVVAVATALALAGSLVQPATAGDPNRFTVYHNLQGALARVSHDCSGTDNSGFARAFRPFAKALHGTGALHVTDTKRSQGGVVLAAETGLPRTVWPVYPVAGTRATPRAKWVVAIGVDRLHSDPFDLVPNRWNKAAIADAQLTNADGSFTGTAQDYLDQHGGPMPFTVSLYTGRCLRSPDVWVDDITRKSGFHIDHADPEPQVWLDTEPLSQYVRYGSTARLKTSLHYGEVDGTVSQISDVDLGLYRHYPGEKTFSKVAHVQTASHRVHRDIRPDRTAYYQWRYAAAQHPKAPYSVSSPVVIVRVVEVINARVVDASLHQDDRLVVTGRVKPDAASITLRVIKVGATHAVFANAHTQPNRTFRVSMRMPDTGSYTATVLAGPVHFRAWSVGVTRNFHVTVS